MQRLESKTHLPRYYIMPGLKYRFQYLKQYDLEKIFKTICDYYHITTDAAKKRDRHRPMVTARQVFMFLISTETQMSLIEIGRFFPCAGDHTTVIHGRNTIRNLMDVDEKMKGDVDWLRMECGL